MLDIIFLFDWQIVFVWGKSLICKVAKDLGLSSVLSLLISFLTLSLTFIIFSFKLRTCREELFLTLLKPTKCICFLVDVGKLTTASFSVSPWQIGIVLAAAGLSGNWCRRICTLLFYWSGIVLLLLKLVSSFYLCVCCTNKHSPCTVFCLFQDVERLCFLWQTLHHLLVHQSHQHYLLSHILPQLPLILVNRSPLSLDVDVDVDDLGFYLLFVSCDHQKYPQL